MCRTLRYKTQRREVRTSCPAPVPLTLSPFQPPPPPPAAAAARSPPGPRNQSPSCRLQSEPETEPKNSASTANQSSKK
ncbi:hypothetical protein XELAEV_18032573mg [Xenopus laevis]|uniref:Uncharacterized protein n=1 Tax=Xenopus laevis TaxID=8355 RepID=A0A974CJ35_XENLA|nr:hypothetical protein XELAEV_18032573mg [Xenopus laevis]